VQARHTGQQEEKKQVHELVRAHLETPEKEENQERD
jgi:hypothetical protein